MIPIEARSLQGQPAGLFSRIVANVLDLGVVVVGVVGAYLGWTAVKLLWQGSSFTRPTPTFAQAFLFATVLNILYFAGAWTTSGRTVGDRVMGLRVLDRSGRRLRLGLALVRGLLCTLFPFGLLWAGISREDRSIQDLGAPDLRDLRLATAGPRALM